MKMTSECSGQVLTGRLPRLLLFWLAFDDVLRADLSFSQASQGSLTGQCLERIQWALRRRCCGGCGTALALVALMVHVRAPRLSSLKSRCGRPGICSGLASGASLTLSSSQSVKTHDCLHHLLTERSDPAVNRLAAEKYWKAPAWAASSLNWRSFRPQAKDLQEAEHRARLKAEAEAGTDNFDAHTRIPKCA